jgi:hypothetical protein
MSARWAESGDRLLSGISGPGGSGRLAIQRSRRKTRSQVWLLPRRIAASRATAMASGAMTSAAASTSPRAGCRVPGQAFAAEHARPGTERPPGRRRPAPGLRDWRPGAGPRRGRRHRGLHREAGPLRMPWPAGPGKQPSSPRSPAARRPGSSRSHRAEGQAAPRPGSSQPPPATGGPPPSASCRQPPASGAIRHQPSGRPSPGLRLPRLPGAAPR